MFEKDMLDNLQLQHLQDANCDYVVPDYFPDQPWQASKQFTNWLDSLNNVPRGTEVN